jgi:hypothetical protein
MDPGRSAALFEEGLEAARRGGDGWARGSGLAGLGWARYFAARFDAALVPLQDAIRLTARSGQRQQFAMALLGRGADQPERGAALAAELLARRAFSQTPWARHFGRKAPLTSTD